MDKEERGRGGEIVNCDKVFGCFGFTESSAAADEICCVFGNIFSV